MVWQKCGKSHNSRSGHAAAMSLATGKVVDYVKKKIKPVAPVKLQTGQAESQTKNMIAEKTTQVHPRPWRLVLQLNGFSRV